MRQLFLFVLQIGRSACFEIHCHTFHQRTFNSLYFRVTGVFESHCNDFTTMKVTAMKTIAMIVAAMTVTAMKVLQ
jgi:hypothetical protein